MKTVGEILRAARKKQGLTLEEVSKKTKITVQYLQAIEENNFKQLPAAAFTKGFITNFAKTVSVDPQNALAIFRRDYDQDERGRIIPRGMAEPVKAKLNLFTPTTTAIAISSAVALIIIVFFLRQIMIFLSAPPLEVTAPENQAQVSSPVMVQGTTKPEASLTINNQPVTVSDSGAFQAQVTLISGEHTLVIKATSRSGKSRTVHRFVTVVDQQDPSSQNQ